MEVAHFSDADVISETSVNLLMQMKSSPLHRAMCFAMALMLGPEGLRAEQPSETHSWSQFRGHNGQSTATSAEIPLHFGASENRLWSVTAPHGSSSPVVWEDRIFLTGFEGQEVIVLCLRRSDGVELWRKPYQGQFEEDYFHQDASPAASTSCVDGRRVISCLGTFGVIAHTLDGDELWRREFDDRSLPFGTGSSPVIWQNRVYILRDTPAGSALLCLDADSGAEIWVAERGATRPSFSTPYLWHRDEGTEVVVAGSGTLRAYDANNGEPLWTVTGMPVFVCPSPVAKEDTLVFGAWATAHVDGAERTRSAFGDGVELSEAELTDAAAFVKRFDEDGNGKVTRNELPESRIHGAFRFFDSDRSGALEEAEINGFFNAKQMPGRNVMAAVRGGGRGDITDSHVLWETTRHLPYVASPVIHDGRVFCLKKGGLLTTWDLQSGDLIRLTRLPVGGEYYATPIVAGDKLIVAAERGSVIIMSTDDKPQVLAQNDLGGAILATPAVVGKQLYIRTHDKLHAIGRGSAE